MPKKDSRVIRVSNAVLDKLEKFKGSRGSWESALQNILSHDAVLWAVPEDLFHTKAQAKGEALKRAVIKKEEVIEPVQVMKVIKDE